MALNRRATVVPAPVDVIPKQSFLGDDGKWSTFVVTVGTPPQKFAVLPSTQSSETTVVLPDGCIASDPSDCQSQRGGLNFNGAPPAGFLTNQSSSWSEIGLFDIEIEKNLGANFSGSALFGQDVVGLNDGNGSSTNGVSLSNQLVGGIATKGFFLGLLGLSTAPASFSSAAQNVNSLLYNLFRDNLIPSLAYSYTAGASYGDNGANNFGSLVLGGYDSTRLDSSKSLSLPFNSKDARALTVGVQSIIATNTLNGTSSLTTNGGHLSLIDSTVSQLWLPQDVCDLFANALGLIYDPQTGLYLLNSTMHDKWVAANPQFTFKIGGSAFDNGKSTNIVIPYKAFDLSISWPFYSSSVNYFPIRRGANDSQYVLGRAFLQESHIIVDYARRNFTLSPAVFPDTTTNTKIVAIKSTSTNSSSSSKLGGGAIAGIVVGSVAFIALLIGLFIFLRRRRTVSQEDKVAELEARQATGQDPYSKVPGIAEVGGDSVQEMPGSDVPHGVHGFKQETAELETPPPVFEMEGDSSRSGSRGTTPYSPVSKNAALRASDASGSMALSPADASPAGSSPRQLSPAQPSPLRPSPLSR